jgi:hypothetical protein
MVMLELNVARRGGIAVKRDNLTRSAVLERGGGRREKRRSRDGQGLGEKGEKEGRAGTMGERREGRSAPPGPTDREQCTQPTGG